MLQVQQGISNTCSTIITKQSRAHGSAEGSGFNDEDSRTGQVIKLIEWLNISKTNHIKLKQQGKNRSIFSAFVFLLNFISAQPNT